MCLGIHQFKLNCILVLGFIILCCNSVQASNIGLPPYTTIDIPHSVYGDHFDMVQDNQNTIYVSYIHGVKIYDGNSWQIHEISRDNPIRKLYYNTKNRVYYGGYQTIGYIEKDIYGKYQHHEILPEKFKNKLESVWFITECNKVVYFQDLHEVFSFNPTNGNIKNWHFESKLGAMECLNQELILQDRKAGLKKLESEKWVKNELQLDNNELLYQMSSLDGGSIFLLSESNDWRIIKNKKVKYLPINEKLPSLDNYVSIIPLTQDEYILGSNNGLITIIDTNKLQFESFQLTNEWISKIIRSNKTELLVLTEFEIFVIQWPSAIRVQGKDFGLASNIKDLTNWNNHLFVSSSSGVLREFKKQQPYENKLYKRLNWTSKEAWSLLPLDEFHALLAESHRLQLVGADLKENPQPISEVIYPRELYSSQYNKNLIYVITEHDAQLLYRYEDVWKLIKIFNSRPLSFIEKEPGLLLLTTKEQGLLELKFDLKNGTNYIIKNVTEEYGLSIEQANDLSLYKTRQDEIYAFNTDDIYLFNGESFAVDSFYELKAVLGEDELIKIIQDENDNLYGYTASHLLYLDKNKKWHSIDMSPYLRGMIDGIKIIDNKIKIVANGIIITYFNNQIHSENKSNLSLSLTEVIFSDSEKKQNLPINHTEIFTYEHGSGSMSFFFRLNDIINQDKVKYSYRVLGYVDTWSYYSEDNRVNLNNLPTGDFTFELQALDMNNHHYVSLGYRFQVKPKWYWTGAAKFAWLLITLLLFFTLFRFIIKWRERIYKSQKTELQTIIDFKTAELELANSNLQKMAHQDGLTGLSNRLYLDRYIDKLVLKDSLKVTAIMLDMDYFKNFNDLNGHIGGDQLLKKLAQHLKKEIDNTGDLVARFGGEEFLVLMINSSLNEVIKKAENIRKLIENKKNKSSVSIGISEMPQKVRIDNSDMVYHLINQADQALYHAKNSGRNRVSVYQETSEK